MTQCNVVVHLSATNAESNRVIVVNSNIDYTRRKMLPQLSISSVAYLMIF